MFCALCILCSLWEGKQETSIPSFPGDMRSLCQQKQSQGLWFATYHVHGEDGTGVMVGLEEGGAAALQQDDNGIDNLVYGNNRDRVVMWLETLQANSLLLLFSAPE